VVDRKYHQMVTELRSGKHQYTMHTCPLWMIFGINLWFETLCNKSNGLAKYA
jgi:phage FluMu gp28-like protein